MKKSIVEMILEFIRQVQRSRRWQRAVTCVAALVVFITTYALVLPAITMEGHHPHLAAEALTGWAGDPLSVSVSAESPAGSGEKVVALTLTGEEAGLSEKYEFDENGVTSVTDAAGQEILLHRTVCEDAKDTVDYWFVLAAGQKTEFTLELEDEIVVDDVIAASGIIENVRASKAEKEAAAVASASNAVAVEKEEFEKATASSAAKASASNALKASASNADLAVAVENDEVDVDEDSGEILDGAVIDDIGAAEMFEGEETEVTAVLKVAAGSGDDLETAIRDAEKNAEKRGDASLGFTWRTVANTNSELTWAGNGVNVSMFYNADAEIPDGAYLSVVEIEEGSDEYQAYYDGAAAAVNDHTEAEVGVASARFFDITILDADGNEIQPASQVVVKINYDNAVELADDADVKAVHFADEGTEVIDTVAGGSATALDEVAFNADHFSVFGVITYGMNTDPVTGEQSFSASANGIAVAVKAEAGAFPEGTYMKVERVDSFGLRDAIEGATGSKVGEITAVDITFYSAEDTEIQPAKPISVALTSDAIKNAENPMIVHVEDDKTEAQVVEEVEVEGRKAEFTAEHFSIYAVVGNGEGGENARATIKFFGKDTTKPIATFYVKNKDLTNDEALNTIVYDPGVDGLSSKEIFKGWNISSKNSTDGLGYTTETETKTIDDIRTFLKSETFTEGDVYNIYAMIFQAYNVQFMDEDNVMIHGETLITKGNEGVSYKINTDYTPKTEDQQFQGWYANSTTTGAVTPSQEVYPFGDEVTIKGDVIFTPNAPRGNWLVFDGNVGTDTQNKPSYTPPQFIKTGDTPTKPSDPTRVGYTFGKWYKDKECTEEFDFNVTLSGRTTVYAKWTAVESANYTVIIWKQNVALNGYDYAESFTLSGEPNTTVNTVSGSGDTATITGRPGGSTVRYTGFTFGRCDQDVTIKANGTSAVNVYFDRKQYTMTFQAQHVYTYTPTSGTSGTQYGLVDGEYVELTYYTRADMWGNPAGWYYGGGFMDRGTQYTGTRYTRSGDGNAWTTVKEITAYYEQDISSNFPIVGYNGTNYNGWVWQSVGSSIFDDGNQVPYIDVMREENTTFHAVSYGTGRQYEYRYYTEALPGVTTPYEFDGKYFDRHATVSISASGDVNATYEEDFSTMDAFSRYKSFPELKPGESVKLTNYGMDFYYTRNKYPVTYYDGVYVDGDGVATGKEGGAHLKTTPESDKVYYQASLKSMEDYFTPAYEGYVFTGWYLDESCTQPFDWNSEMPKGGIKLYAKWVAVQYRIFLHANVDSSDTSLDWGGQSMSFRVDEDEKLADGNKIIGTRDDYEIVGWYTDEAFTNPFNFEAYTINSGLPYLTDYDQTEPTELNKYSLPEGDTTNHDKTGGRIWIKKKLDLYAKWREIMKGARGIQIIYDAGEGVNSANHEQEYTDPLYYLDDSNAIAQPASIPTDETQHFVKWHVQKWNGSEWVESGDVVFPGDSFNVKKSNALKEDNPDWDGETENERFLYTIKVVAEYGPKDVPIDTHIDWYYNDGTGKEAIHVDNELQINEAVEIQDEQTRSGYSFLGWAKKNEFEADGETAIKDYDGLGEGDLFLKWNAEESGYLAKNSDGIWVDVTQVAADEILPYEALYAVWKKNPSYLRIVKIDQDEKYLADAKFTLSRQNASGEYDELQTDITSVAEQTGVTLYEHELTDGTYKLTETEAPEHYRIDTKDVVFTVTNGVPTAEGFQFAKLYDDNNNYIYAITLKNTRTVSVIITKNVDGLDTDKTTEFEFNFAYGTTVSETKRLVGDENSQDHSVTYSDVPYGAEVKIAETANPIFDTKYSINGGEASTGAEAKFTVNADTENAATNAVNIVFTNSRNQQAVAFRKVDADNNSKVLPDAVFTMTDGKTTYSLTSTDGNFHAKSGETEVVSLPVGEYSLKEKTPPAGYKLPSGTISMTVSATDVKWQQSDNSANQPKTAEVINGEHVVIITNNSGVSLPSTGGRGTLPFRIAGLALMLMGAAYVSYDFKTRRRRERRLKK